jgi:branched-chain amino acid transport system ATP-binding protein
VSEVAGLSISNLTVKFGGLVALDDVFIDIAPNTIVGLIGPNGAGKTTVFNSISGLVTPTSGTISIHGQSMDWPAPHELADFGIARTLQVVQTLLRIYLAYQVKRRANFADVQWMRWRGLVHLIKPRRCLAT